jgi:hypothetical protein
MVYKKFIKSSSLLEKRPFLFDCFFVRQLRQLRQKMASQLMDIK